MLSEALLYKVKALFSLITINKTLQLIDLTEEPGPSEAECRARGLSYASSLRLTISVTTGDEAREVLRREQIPRLTERGSWLILGRERSPIERLHQPPGVFFSYSEAKKTYRASLLPKRGAKLHVELDPKGILVPYLNQQKLTLPMLLSAFGCGTERALCLGDTTRYTFAEGRFWCSLEDSTRLRRSAHKVRGPHGERLLELHQVITPADVQRLKEVWGERFPVDEVELENHICAQDIMDYESGEVLVECNERLTRGTLQRLKTQLTSPFRVLDLSDELSRSLHQTYSKHPTHDPDAVNCYKLFSLVHKRELSLYPEEQQEQEAREWLAALRSDFFSARARARLNALPHRVTRTEDEDLTLTPEDLIEALRHLLLFKEQREELALPLLCFQRFKTNEELLDAMVELWLRRWREDLSQPITPDDIEATIAREGGTLLAHAEAYFQQEMVMDA
jgi:DNA-directed RNA polymerase beta subunit